MVTRLLLSTTRVLGSVVMRPASGAQLLESARLEQRRPRHLLLSLLFVSNKHGLVDLHRAVLRSTLYVAILVVARVMCRCAVTTVISFMCI
jgi:hypothetical protein